MISSDVSLPVIDTEFAEWAKSDFSDDPDVKAIAFKKCFNVAIAGNFIVGVMNVILALGGPIIMSVLPPAALLVPIAGIGFSFLGIGQMVGLPTCLFFVNSRVSWHLHSASFFFSEVICR